MSFQCALPLPVRAQGENRVPKPPYLDTFVRN